MSRVVEQTMGKESAELYTGVGAMIVESAAPYSVLGLIFVIPYARGNLVGVALGQVWAKATVRIFSLASVLPAHQLLLAVPRPTTDRPARRV